MPKWVLVDADDVGAPGGVAKLDAGGKLPAAQLPDSVGRDRGSGTSLPTGDVRRGDVFYHEGLFSLLININGVSTGWRQAGRARVFDDAAVATMATAYTTTLYDGFAVYSMASDTEFVWTGSAFVADALVKARAQLRQTTAQGSLPAGWTTITFGFADVQIGGAGWTSGSRWTCPAGQAGLYMIEGKVESTTDYDLNARITKNGAVLPYGTGVSSNGKQALSAAVTGTKLINLAVGDYVELQGYRSVGWATAVYGDGTSMMTVVRLD